MKKLILFGLIIICVVFTACDQDSGFKEKTFFSMDTAVYMKLDTDKGDVFDDAFDLLKELDKKLSRHSDGQTALYNTSDNGCYVDRDVAELIGISQEVTEQCDGTFSVFSGGLTALWSESETYPSDADIMRGVQSVKAAQLSDDGFLQRQGEDTLLEFGGIAKGYACDKLVELLESNGVRSGMVSFTSSIGVFGTNPEGKPWRIALKDPTDTQKIMGYLTLEKGFISVSGDYERFYEIEGKKYNHIIDVKSGLPVDNGVHSVVVIAKSGALSDALSTAFFVMGPEAVAEKYGESSEVKYLIVANGQIYMNDSMANVFSEK